MIAAVGTLLLLGALSSGLLLGWQDAATLAHLAAGAALVGSGLLRRPGQRRVPGARRPHSQVLLVTAGAVLSILLLNWLVLRGAVYWRQDLTVDERLSLRPETRALLEKLPERLLLVGILVPEPVKERQLRRLLTLFEEQHNPRVEIELINPRTQPERMQHYQLQPGEVMLLRYGTQREARLRMVSQEIIASTIRALQRPVQPRVLYLTGYGEPDPEAVDGRGVTRLRQLLTNEGFALTPASVAGGAALPTDADLLLIAAPTRDIPESDRESIRRFLACRGRLLVLGEPNLPESFRTLIGSFGATVEKNVVVDLTDRAFGAKTLSAQVVMRDFPPSDLTGGLSARTPVVFQVAASVVKRDPAVDGMTVTKSVDIVLSSPTSWAETSLTDLFESDEPRALLEESDQPGPVAVGVAIEQQRTEDPPAGCAATQRIVVFGDSDWVSDGLLEQYFNQSLLLASVSWLGGREFTQTIESAAESSEALRSIDPGIIRLLSLLALMMPELVGITGLLLWKRRQELKEV